MLSSVGIFTKIKGIEDEEENKSIQFGLTPLASLLQSSEKIC